MVETVIESNDLTNRKPCFNLKTTIESKALVETVIESNVLTKALVETVTGNNVLSVKQL